MNDSEDFKSGIMALFYRGIMNNQSNDPRQKHPKCQALMSTVQ